MKFFLSAPRLLLSLSRVLLLVLVLGPKCFASAHAVLVDPQPRNGMGKTAQNPNGKKLVGESVFRNLPVNPQNAQSGCGSAASTGNPGAGAALATWQAGKSASICWETTIPHPDAAGQTSPGVRLSIAYSATDRFDLNVLATGVDAGATGKHCQTVALPAGKICDSCVLQWSWVSIPDGGAYLGCADVRIVNQNQQPDPSCTGSNCDCKAGEASFTDLPYPISVPIALKGGQDTTILCGQAHKGYVSTKSTHTGFQIKCNAKTGTVYIGPNGGSCAAYPKCSSAAANPDAVCGPTYDYDSTKGNEPCSSSPCKVADRNTCCKVSGCTDQASQSCMAISVFSGQSGQCNSRLGTSKIKADGNCNELQGGGAVRSWYILECVNGVIKGKYACDSNSCINCAVQDFRSEARELDQCVSKPFLCNPGDPQSCTTEDVVVSTCDSPNFSFFSDSGTLATSALSTVAVAAFALA